MFDRFISGRTVFETLLTINFQLIQLSVIDHGRRSIVFSHEEKMRGQRGRLPVQLLGYVMSTKVIFRRAEASVLAEVCFPKRPHAGLIFERKAKITCIGG